MAIALSGVMAYTTSYYLDTTSISKENLKSQVQSHLNVLTSVILQCKEYSGMMPVQNDGSIASDTLLTTMDCNTSTTYALDGGKGSFIPQPLNNFTAYKATQSGEEFYFSTSTNKNTIEDEILLELNSTYSAKQYELSYDATTTYLKFYLSR